MSGNPHPIDALPEALIRLAPRDGTILEANRRARRLFGGTLVGRRIQEIDAAPDAARYWLDRLADPQQAAIRQTSVIRADGERIRVEIRSAVAEDRGEAASVWLTLRTSAEVGNTSRRLQAALRYARVGHWSLQAEPLVATWSDECYRILDLSRDYSAGPETLSTRLHPEDRERVLESIRASLEREADHHINYRVVHRDGAIRWINCQGQPVRNGDGEVQGLEGFLQDITEYKQAQHLAEQERQRAEHYLEVAGSILLALDREGRVSLINPKGCKVLGRPQSAILGRDWFSSFLPPADAPGVRALFERILAGMSPTEQPAEGRVLNDRGEVRQIAWHNSVLRDAQGAIIGTLSSGSDVTAQREAEQELRGQKRFLQHVIDGIEDPVLVVDREYRLLRTNRTAAARVDASRRGLEGMACYQLIANRDQPCDDAVSACPLHHVLETGKPSKVLHRRRDASGRMRTLEVSASPLLGDHETIEGVIEIARDISDHIELLEAVQLKDQRYAHLAQYDPLTELPNRFLFADRLEQAVQSAGEMGTKLAVLLLDVDDFKQVNDGFDHRDGDAVLKTLAKRLESAVAGADTLARMGGDEFGVILANVEDDDEVGREAQALLARFDAPFEIREHRLFLTASIGISLSPDHGDNGDDLVRNADAALSRAKCGGRRSFQFYTRDLTTRAYERMVLESNLHEALAERELILHYQPQLRLGSNRLCGVEALVRWQHPTRGLLGPDEFIPLAESTGLIMPLGDWVLHEACHQMHRWLEDGLLGPQTVMCVNIAAAQLADEQFVGKIGRCLAAVGLDSANLELEITETSVMTNPDVSAARLAQLRDLGVKLAIDDFGTGYSSLSYLKQLPLTKLKIDRSFVSELPGNADDLAIASAVVALGKSLSLEVLAEGVETVEQSDWLLEQGCQQAQGYLFSRPLPAAAFAAFCAELSRSETIG